MMATQRLELLMQRAADGELSVAQRHELLELAEQQPDGWKQLACTFLEEQLVGGAVRHTPVPAPDVSVAPAQPQTSSDRKTFWYRHPMLSTVVTMCLAFAVGLTVPGLQEERPAGVVRQEQVPTESAATVGLDRLSPAPQSLDEMSREEMLQRLRIIDQLLHGRR